MGFGRNSSLDHGVLWVSGMVESDAMGMLDFNDAGLPLRRLN
jgi:hypothetical protein